MYLLLVSVYVKFDLQDLCTKCSYCF